MKKAVSWLLLFLIVLASPTQAALLARNWAFDHSLYQGKNRLSGHNDQNDNLTNNNGMAFTSNGADQLTKAGSTALAYNGAGQATSVGQWAMKFAYNDQIKSITGQALNAQYLYDGNGQRVQKTVNGAVQNFLWNGGSIAKEYKPDGSVRADYQLGAGAKIDGKWQFYLSDIQGSTLGVTDDTGKVIATWSYSDYGVTTQTSGDKNLYQPFLYTHSELDSETGFYHNKARHYAPKFGKFLARDLIASSNLYSYANSDPINGIDPNGTNVILEGLLVLGIAYEAYDYFSGNYEARHNAIIAATPSNSGAVSEGSPPAVNIGLMATGLVGAGARLAKGPCSTKGGYPSATYTTSGSLRTLSGADFNVKGMNSFTGSLGINGDAAWARVDLVTGGGGLRFRELVTQLEDIASSGNAKSLNINFSGVDPGVEDLGLKWAATGGRMGYTGQSIEIAPGTYVFTFSKTLP